MPKKNLRKSIVHRLTKIRKQAPHFHISPSSISSTMSRLIERCKHPKSLPFAHRRDPRRRHHHPHDDTDEHDRKDDAATLEDIDRFLSENFKSLYGQDEDEEGENKEKDQDQHQSPGIRFDESRKLPPDLCGSHRFDISPAASPSYFNSVCISRNGSDLWIGSTSTKTTANNTTQDPEQVADDHGNETNVPIDDCIAVLTASPNPYHDFGRSMQEIIESRIRRNQRVDWDFMEELLFRYLRLNEKKQYRYILSAFLDWIVALRQNSSQVEPRDAQGGIGDIDQGRKKRGD